MGGLGRPSEPRERAGVMLRSLDLVDLVIRHPGFSIRLCVASAPSAPHLRQLKVFVR
jgi:hypothetical protein